MQVHLDVENGREAASRFAHVGEPRRFVDGERVGAAKLDQEQIILNEIVTKRRLGERTVCQPVREGVLGIGPPLGGCRGLQLLEETHDLSQGWLPSEYLWPAIGSQATSRAKRMSALLSSADIRQGSVTMLEAPSLPISKNCRYLTAIGDTVEPEPP